MDLELLLQKSSRDHQHLCPRQVLGVRLGLAGLHALGFDLPPAHKRLLVITETDGCFVDGLTAATGCTVGHRTLRVEDYGKTVAVFVDTLSEECVRVAPVRDLRDKAAALLADQPPYQAQLRGYQLLPEAEMFISRPVALTASLAAIIARPGLRVNCAICGEEIMNAREIWQAGKTLCRACATSGYFRWLD